MWQLAFHVLFSHLADVSRVRRVQQALDAWDSLRRRGEEAERLLRAALVDYANGAGPRPDQLLSLAIAQRRDCEGAVRAVVDAIASTSPGEAPEHPAP
jgi:hypothetical protein